MQRLKSTPCTVRRAAVVALKQKMCLDAGQTSAYFDTFTFGGEIIESPCRSLRLHAWMQKIPRLIKFIDRAEGEERRAELSAWSPLGILSNGK